MKKAMIQLKQQGPGNFEARLMQGIAGLDSPFTRRKITMPTEKQTKANHAFADRLLGCAGGLEKPVKRKSSKGAKQKDPGIQGIM